MTTKPTVPRKLIVVDADVARACSSRTGAAPLSSDCAKTLRAIYGICHRLAITDEGIAEWNCHQSPFFIEWRADMASRGKLERRSGAFDAELADGIVAAVTTGRAEHRIRKDLHLLAAALSADQIVLSCEVKACRDYASAATAIDALRDIHWINPRHHHLADVVSWLEDGAPPRDEWKLGYEPDD